jgi:hypothetical protein
MMTTTRIPIVIRPATLCLLALLLSGLLAACSQPARADIPTASENQEAAPANPAPASESQPANPAEPNPAPVDEEDAILVYAQCVRDNGFPEFPDPIPGRGIMLRRDQGMSFNDPRMRAAMEACQDLRPPGMGGGSVAGDPAEAMETMLAFAQCMRENGVPGFPDPSSEGGRMVIGSDAGINPNSPTFQAAVQACAGHIQGGVMMGGSNQ